MQPKLMVIIISQLETQNIDYLSFQVQIACFQFHFRNYIIRCYFHYLVHFTYLKTWTSNVVSCSVFLFHVTRISHIIPMIYINKFFLLYICVFTYPSAFLELEKKTKKTENNYQCFSLHS